jgi:hypothetical protein
MAAIALPACSELKQRAKNTKKKKTGQAVWLFTASVALVQTRPAKNFYVFVVNQSIVFA